MVHFRSHNLGLTLASGRVVFLDLAADRYFGLAQGPEAAVRAQIEAVRSRAPCCRPSLSFGSHLFEPIEDLPPTTSLLDRPLPPAQPWAVASAVSARARATLQLRRQPLQKILSRLAHRKSSLADMAGNWRWDEPSILSIVAAYQTSGRIVSDHDRCLSLSLALARTVISRGFAVDFVIGVSGAPFAAHAWVQHGTTLLADQIDRVRRFSPVMTI
jgi:hypothetical protein